MGQAKQLSVSNAEMQQIRAFLESKFDGLKIYPYVPESEATDEYNCIAWAADDTENWWWPIRNPLAYWPLPSLIVHKDNFIAAFNTLEYEECGDNFDLEPDFEKVALYLDTQDTPTHMARQLESGVWTSKLGEGWDVVHHTLKGIEGSEYGYAAIALRRPRKR